MASNYYLWQSSGASSKDYEAGEDWNFDPREVLERPFTEWSYTWYDILGPADSDRCGVCKEVKWDRSYKLGDTQNGEDLFICSTECVLYSWDNVVQLRRKSINEQVCALPGCVGLGGPKNGNYFYYCSKEHKRFHYALCKKLLYCTELSECLLPGCFRLCPTLKNYCCKYHKQFTLPCSSCAERKGPVKFYNHYEPFYEFSNFYEFAPFVLNGVKWKSSEHYFQAKKFEGTPYEEQIQLCDSPRKAFDLSRKYGSTGWIRGDWDKEKQKVMYLALLAKFFSHERLRLLLCSTGKREIREHTYNDSYWGDGGGIGENHLGKLLMDVRSVLRGEEKKYLKT